MPQHTVDIESGLCCEDGRFAPLDTCPPLGVRLNNAPSVVEAAHQQRSRQPLDLRLELTDSTMRVGQKLSQHGDFV